MLLTAQMRLRNRGKRAGCAESLKELAKRIGVSLRQVVKQEVWLGAQKYLGNMGSRNLRFGILTPKYRNFKEGIPALNQI